jgi:hypothetical protein
MYMDINKKWLVSQLEQFEKLGILVVNNQKLPRITKGRIW